MAVYDGHYLEFDESHRDTCVLLGQPLPRDSRKDLAAVQIEPIEREMGGTVEPDATQVFVATHSLFLLRELEIQSKTDDFGNVNQRYFALAIRDDNVRVEQGDTADELRTLLLLDENLQQSDRYLALED